MASTNDTFVASQQNAGEPTLSGASETATGSGWGDSVLGWLTGAEKIVSTAAGAVKVFNGSQPATEAKPTPTPTTGTWWSKYGQTTLIAGGAVVALVVLLAVLKRR